MINKAILLTLINIAGRLVNFYLFIIIANKFGAKADTDWFFLTYGTVYFLAGILFNTSEYTLIPIWNKTEEKYHQFIFSKIKYYSIIIFILSITIVLFTSFIAAPILGIKIPNNNISKALTICIILGIQPSISFISSIFSSYMQYKQEYVLPTIHLAIRSLGIIPIIIMNFCNSILCLSISFLAGELLRLTFLYKKKYLMSKFSDSQPEQANLISHVVKSTMWMTLGLSLVIANPLVDLAMVGKLGEGSASLVEYAGRLRGLPILAFNGILILLLGEWANQHAKTALTWENVSKYFYGSVLAALVVVSALSLSINQWITLVFFSSKFTNAELSILKNLLLFYFSGIPMLIGVFILTRIIIIHQKYRLFTLISVSAFILNILLNLIFINRFGINGVAISTSSVDLFSVISFYFLVKKIMN